jgi:hypothetical protein
MVIAARLYAILIVRRHGPRRRNMGVYEDIGNKSAEEVLRGLSGSDFVNGAPNAINYILAVAQVRSNGEAIRSQEACATRVITSIDALTKSINRASDDSGRLGVKVAILTAALVGVGAGQIVATAWPYLAWWWHH